jgi:adenine-specific DNA glycosylase
MDTSTPSWLKEVLRRQELMDSVMQKSGVDVLTAIRADNGQAFFEARTKCRVCPHERDCRNWWLESCETLRLPPNFCPNANFFRACKRANHPLRRHPPRRDQVLARGTFVGKPKPPNVPFEQRASSELIKLIWKLRWIGEEEEAEEAQMQLARIQARMQVLRVPYAGSPPGMLNDTD